MASVPIVFRPHHWVLNSQQRLTVYGYTSKHELVVAQWHASLIKNKTADIYAQYSELLDVSPYGWLSARRYRPVPKTDPRHDFTIEIVEYVSIDDCADIWTTMFMVPIDAATVGIDIVQIQRVESNTTSCGCAGPPTVSIEDDEREFKKLHRAYHVIVTSAPLGLRHDKVQVIVGPIQASLDMLYDMYQPQRCVVYDTMPYSVPHSIEVVTLKRYLGFDSIALAARTLLATSTVKPVSPLAVILDQAITLAVLWYDCVAEEMMALCQSLNVWCDAVDSYDLEFIGRRLGLSRVNAAREVVPGIYFKVYMYDAGATYDSLLGLGTVQHQSLLVSRVPTRVVVDLMRAGYVEDVTAKLGVQVIMQYGPYVYSRELNDKLVLLASYDVMLVLPGKMVAYNAEGVVSREVEDIKGLAEYCAAGVQALNFSGLVCAHPLGRELEELRVIPS